ncbi:MAG: hypothetical protein ACRDL5_03895 [Solirubrobacteraceae bacterium]
MRTWARLSAALCAVVALAGFCAGGALAASSTQEILSECSSGALTHTFTKAQLQQALQAMPASQRQYSPCVDVIEAALAGAGGHSGSGGGPSGGSFLPTPVIVIIVIVILAGVTLGAVAVRRRQTRPPGGGPPSDTS